MLAVPSQNSVIFYFGLEGLGGLDMDSNEEENVGPNISLALLLLMDGAHRV